MPQIVCRRPSPGYVFVSGTSAAVVRSGAGGRVGALQAGGAAEVYLAGDLGTVGGEKRCPCDAADWQLEVSSLQPFHYGYPIYAREKLISARVGMLALADEL